MERRTGKRWSTKHFSVFVAAMVIGWGNMCKAGDADTSDKFETLRAHIQAWLSEVGAHKSILSSSYMKQTIVDDWDNQSNKYQIVSVRKPDDFNKAGHIPNAINIYWIDIVMDENLALLDSNKTLILYCYYGHGSMITSTILGLLGYRCCSLNFGMMDWNLDALVKKPWDQKADYAVEATVNRSKETYLLPLLISKQSDTRSIIKELARKYLAGEGSPVISSSDIKAIVDDWDNKNVEYQVVDVRPERDYKTGHVPRSINIPLAKIAEIENLRTLDPNKTAIVYSENGQSGQIATTVLSLLGYKAVNMLFGMMDWNKAYVDKSKQWDGSARYPVEHGK